MRCVACLALAALAVLPGEAAFAQDYPVKPVHLA